MRHQAQGKFPRKGRFQARRRSSRSNGKRRKQGGRRTVPEDGKQVPENPLPQRHRNHGPLMGRSEADPHGSRHSANRQTCSRHYACRPHGGATNRVRLVVDTKRVSLCDPLSTVAASFTGRSLVDLLICFRRQKSVRRLTERNGASPETLGLLECSWTAQTDRGGRPRLNRRSVPAPSGGTHLHRHQNTCTSSKPV